MKIFCYCVYPTQVGMSRHKKDFLSMPWRLSHAGGNESIYPFITIIVHMFIPRMWE